MFTLDCRDKVTLEDGSTCVFMKNSALHHLPHFDLYDSSGALLVKCRTKGKLLLRYLSFTDAAGQELATIRFQRTLPVLHLPDGSEIELNFFRHLGTDFYPEAEVELFGSTLRCKDGVFTIPDDIPADKQGLLKAVLCFCLQYPKLREKELERASLISWADILLLILAVGAVYIAHFG